MVMKAALIFFILMLVAAIVLFVLSNKKGLESYVKRLLAKIASLLGWMGAVALILFFFRYEAVPFLSRRFWYGLWCVGIIIWIVFILRYWLKEVPRQRQERIAKERLKKYLP